MNPQNIVMSQIDIIDEVGDVSLPLYYDDYDTAVQTFFNLSEKYYAEYPFGGIDIDLYPYTTSAPIYPPVNEYMLEFVWSYDINSYYYVFFDPVTSSRRIYDEQGIKDLYEQTLLFRSFHIQT